jgi:L-asparaginase II
MTPGVSLAEVTRRDVTTDVEVVESLHGGHLVVTGGDGEVLGALGDPQQVTFPRSVVKPFQVAACLEALDLSGSQPSPAEIAIAWSSHRAEPRHLEVVRRLLARSGTRPDQLTCTPLPGQHDPGAAPTALRSDCSGKHALFALLAREVGAPRERILPADGPVQRVVLAGVADALGPPAAIGVDGCGAPAVAVPLAAVARGYGRLAGEQRYARVLDAGLSHPELVGGEGRLESALLDAGVVAKVGAEGVYGAGWLGRDGRPRGAAVKAADGAVRGVAVALLTLLTELGVVRPGVWYPPRPQGGGRPEGSVRALPAVAALARSTPGAR